MSANAANRPLRLSLAALGIVYGDIGTSPLYALRECFGAHYGLARSADNVLGVLSLITWSLILIVTLKYLLVMMKADNKGEGGIVALLALLNPWHARRGSRAWLLMVMGLAGVALLFADGAITPAISVLSAVEGLGIAAPQLQHWVVPITIGILIALFRFQRYGTARVGALFGPVVLIWFLTLAVLGLRAIAAEPQVLLALDPRHAFGFLFTHGFGGFALLGSVFLVATGAEALYADMGHFGKTPIRRAWFAVVFPALLLNYFGQGALIIATPDAADAPFYRLVDGWLQWPLVGLATAATIIASQAMITGAFSLAGQLVQLDQLPRIDIVQTSAHESGQIYVPVVNALLLIATVVLVVGFGSSTALASVYGIAVSSTMVITTVLAYFVARRFGWHPLLALGLTLLFLFVDLGFFGANLLKLGGGGWYPLLAAALLFTVMTTWSRGRQIMARRLAHHALPVDAFLEEIRNRPPSRLHGTGIFLTSGDRVPAGLVHYMRRNRALHTQVVLLSVSTHDVPRLPPEDRVHWEALGPGLLRVGVHCGFMQGPDITAALSECALDGRSIDLSEATYYLGRDTAVPTREVPGMALWREQLFALLVRNARRADAYYRLPPEQVVELGFHVRI